jgi:hypothetical protein
MMRWNKFFGSLIPFHPVTAAICHELLLSAVISNYLPVSFAMCCYLLSSAILYHYLPPSASTGVDAGRKRQ